MPKVLFDLWPKPGSCLKLLLVCLGFWSLVSSTYTLDTGILWCLCFTSGIILYILFWMLFLFTDHGIWNFPCSYKQTCLNLFDQCIVFLVNFTMYFAIFHWQTQVFYSYLLLWKLFNEHLFTRLLGHPSVCFFQSTNRQEKRLTLFLN